MKRITSIKIRLFAAAFAALGSLATAQAGSFFSDFNSGTPAGSTVYPNAFIDTTGGYTNSGCLKLTLASGTGAGSFIIDDLDSTTPVVSFTASYKVYIGSYGNGADGMSFNFAPDLPNSIFGQEGAGTGYTVEFDTYPNGAPDTAPSIDAKVGSTNNASLGNELATSIFANLRENAFVDCVVQLNPNNTLTVIYDGFYIYSNLVLTAYSPVGGSRFGLGASTGGLTDNHWVDNLNITTFTNGTPYVNSFAPRGRAVATNSPVDIVLTDHTTQVDTNSIVLQVNGSTVTPTITTNGTGNTFIHYVKPGGFALGSTPTVSLTFSNNAAPTAQNFTWQYSFTTVPPPAVTTYVDVFNDSFETYASAATATVGLDKNAAGPNAALNGSGNPWFGPAPFNDWVMRTTGGVIPHTGTNMIRAYAAANFDEILFNMGYRLRGGNVLQGNFLAEWWFYDPAGPGAPAAHYQDMGVVGQWISTVMPGNADYGTIPKDYITFDNTNRAFVELGGGQNISSGYDNTKYQTRIEGGSGYNNGNYNTTTTRSIGWHQARIVFGPPTNNQPNITMFIDDMVNPTFSILCPTTAGFNALGFISAYGSGATALGYFDDVRVALAVPPKLTPTLSGNTLSFTWPAGFTLQSALDVTGPYADVSTTYTGFDYDITSNPQQFFRLKN